MNKIYIGFSRPKGGFQPFSWIIRLVTWSAVSHAYVKFYSVTSNRWIIFQASGFKVNFIGQDLFESKEFVVKEFGIAVADNMRLQTMQFMIDKCGMPYAIMEDIGILWVLLAAALGEKAKNPFATTSSFFCSQIADMILAELSPGDRLDPSATTPQALMDYLSKRPSVCIETGKTQTSPQTI